MGKEIVVTFAFIQMVTKKASVHNELVRIFSFIGPPDHIYQTTDNNGGELLITQGLLLIPAPFTLECSCLYRSLSSLSWLSFCDLLIYKTSQVKTLLPSPLIKFELCTTPDAVFHGESDSDVLLTKKQSLHIVISV